MTWHIVDERDDAVIMAVLNRDREWAAYAICDLDPPYRQHVRYIGAYRSGVIEAVVLAYQLPDFTVIVPCGSASGVRTVLERVDDLPELISLQVRPADRAAAELRYHSTDLAAMERMIARAGHLRGGRAVPGIQIARLDLSLAGQLMALYERLPGTRPSGETFRTMIEHGIYYGAFDGSQLVAVAGTHAISDRFSVATVGGVFTAPERRGRGLARATTGAVVQALVQRGIAEIALNVRADNAPAVAAYRHLGFEVYCHFWEGGAALRD